MTIVIVIINLRCPGHRPRAAERLAQILTIVCMYVCMYIYIYIRNIYIYIYIYTLYIYIYIYINTNNHTVTTHNNRNLSNMIGTNNINYDNHSIIDMIVNSNSINIINVDSGWKINYPEIGYPEFCQLIEQENRDPNNALGQSIKKITVYLEFAF